jgi:Heterokaryon incompatibility protein (HET)
MTDSHDLYSPLNPEPGSIKLIKLLLCDQPDSGIECALYEASMDDETKFQALSYVWAKEDGEFEPISLNDHSFLVTQSLKNALHRIRRLSPIERILYVICINQAGLEERSAQVRQMRHIYECAE